MELLAEERADRILKLVEERKFVKVEELAELFDVSHRTIRRDFEKLEQNGLLKRTYGGAMTTRVDDSELGMDVRGDFFATEKQRIGKAAADMVEDGEAIMLDAGTTVQYVAKYIKTRRGLTVVTNAVNIINELANCEGITLVVTGGTLRPSTFSLVGAQTQEMLRNINADWAFIGTSGITLRQGFTNTNLFEAEVKKAMIASAKKVMVLVDHSKFDKVSFASFASLKDIDGIITDSGATEEQLKPFKDAGIEVIVV